VSDLVAGLLRRGSAPVEFYRFQYVGTSTAIAKWNASDVAREFYIEGAIHPTGGAIREIYLPAAVIREAIEGTDERSGTGLKITVDAANTETDAITDLYRSGGPVTPMEVCVYRGHRGHYKVVREFYGNVTAAEFSGSKCTLNCEPKSGALQHPILRQLYQGTCNNTLYDTFCGVAKASFATAGTVDTITADGLTIEVSEADALADGYFAAGGLLEFGSRRGFITAHVGPALTLFRAVPGLVVSSSVTIYPGCDRSLADCGTKFSNIGQHMGFPFIPSVDPFTDGVD
jgi:uncharacterized phage protein (TIGR02218 family)